MIVRMLTAIAGKGFSYAAGELFDTDGATAARLIANGYAERVDTPQREAAMQPRARARGLA